VHREAALAWEAAFVQLAATKLTNMAEGAGLRLSLSTERSVEDELARESTSGKPTKSSRLDLLCLPSRCFNQHGA
jgi:Niemann-Pick C1 protein